MALHLLVFKIWVHNEIDKGSGKSHSITTYNKNMIKLYYLGRYLNLKLYLINDKISALAIFVSSCKKLSIPTNNNTAKRFLVRVTLGQSYFISFKLPRKGETFSCGNLSLKSLFIATEKLDRPRGQIRKLCSFNFASLNTDTVNTYWG